MKRFKGQTGMSLVEATIILLVLMLLTAVLAPSINDFVNDAKDVKVKEDCEAIGVSVMRLARDVGPCFKFAASTACTKQNHVEILYSNGPDVVAADVDTGGTAPNFSNNNLFINNFNWDKDGSGDSLQHQLVENSSSYTTPGGVLNHNPLKGYEVPGPAFYLGWRGAYLSSPIGPDPWGRRYLVNSAFLSSATDASDTGSEGNRLEGWRRDTFCISGGRDVLFSTNIAGNSGAGTVRSGDDFIYIISGDTR